MKVRCQPSRTRDYCCHLKAQVPSKEAFLALHLISAFDILPWTDPDHQPERHVKDQIGGPFRSSGENQILLSYKEEERLLDLWQGNSKYHDRPEA